MNKNNNKRIFSSQFFSHRCNCGKTFFVIDRFNEYMAFMSSEISKWVIAGLALCALLSAVRLILADQAEPRPRKPHPSERED